MTLERRFKLVRAGSGHSSPANLTRVSGALSFTAHEPGNPRLRQLAFAAASVQVRLQLRPALAIVLDSPQMLPLRTKRLGKTVQQSEGHELCESRFIAMRQIAAFVPAAETLNCILVLGRRGVAPLVCYQLSDLKEKRSV